MVYTISELLSSDKQASPRKPVLGEEKRTTAAEMNIPSFNYKPYPPADFSPRYTQSPSHTSLGAVESLLATTDIKETHRSDSPFARTHAVIHLPFTQLPPPRPTSSIHSYHSRWHHSPKDWNDDGRRSSLNHTFISRPKSVNCNQKLEQPSLISESLSTQHPRHEEKQAYPHSPSRLLHESQKTPMWTSTRHQPYPSNVTTVDKPISVTSISMTRDWKPSTSIGSQSSSNRSVLSTQERTKKVVSPVESPLSSSDGSPFSSQPTSVENRAPSKSPISPSSDQGWTLVLSEGRKQYVCDCGKTFLSRCHLNRHSLVHSQHRQFSCPISGCHSQFKRYDNMVQHFRLRHEDRLDYLLDYAVQVKQDMKRKSKDNTSPTRSPTS